MNVIYELQIGIQDETHKTVFYQEYISSSSLNSAKSRATRKVKTLETMRKYTKWGSWSKPRDLDGGSWGTIKESEPIGKEFGFCELTWEDLQMSLF